MIWDKKYIFSAQHSELHTYTLSHTHIKKNWYRYKRLPWQHQNCLPKSYKDSSLIAHRTMIKQADKTSGSKLHATCESRHEETFSCGIKPAVKQQWAAVNRMVMKSVSMDSEKKKRLWASFNKYLKCLGFHGNGSSGWTPRVRRVQRHKTECQSS